MKHILPCILLTVASLIIPLGVIARDSDQVGKELENINYSEIPYGVRMIDAKIQITPSPGVTSPPVQSDSEMVKGYMVKAGNISSYEEKKQVDNNIFESIIRGLGSLITSIGDLFNFGNQKALNVLNTMAPCGLPDKALGADNPNCKNGQIVIDGKITPIAEKTGETKVLGSIINMAPMEKGLDLGYCSQLPYGTGDCLKNNTPFSNTQPAIIPSTITPTP